MTRRGLTLIELLVVLSVLIMVFIAVVMIAMASTRIHARYSPSVEPQSSMLLALERMQRKMREAILIDVHSADTCIEIGLPAKDACRVNIVGAEGLQIGSRICYFLGHYNAAQTPTTVFPWRSTDDVGDDSRISYALFAIEQPGDVTNLPLKASYPVSQVREVVNGILRQPIDPGDASGTATTSIFSYTPLDADGYLTQETRLVRIVLTRLVTASSPSGYQTTPLTLWTQFCLRNKQPGT